MNDANTSYSFSKKTHNNNIFTIHTCTLHRMVPLTGTEGNI